MPRTHWPTDWRLAPASGEPDSELLRRVQDTPGDGIAAIVDRYGDLVLGTCQRVLRDRHLAEDAFQATFVILARQAGTIRGVLPAWLHRVARRTSSRLLRQRKPLQSLASEPAAFETDVAELCELLSVLDDEIARLPAKHRHVVQLCYLQQCTAEAASQSLGIPRGTVLSRLDAARRKLQDAFARRGITSLAILTLPTLAATVSSALAEATAKSAALPVLSTTFTTLVSREMLSMAIKKWLAGATVIMVLVGLGGGAMLWPRSEAADETKPGTSKPKLPPIEPMNEKEAIAEKQLKIVVEKLNILDKKIDRLELEAKVVRKEIIMQEIGENSLRAIIEKEESKLLESALPLMDKKNRLKSFKELVPTSPTAAELRKMKPIDLVEFVEKLEDDPDGYIPVAEAIQLANDVVKAELRSKSFLARNQDWEYNLKLYQKKYNEIDYERLASNLEKFVKTSLERSIKNCEIDVARSQNTIDATRSRRDELVARLIDIKSNETDRRIKESLDLLYEMRRMLAKLQFRLELQAAGIELPLEK